MNLKKMIWDDEGKSVRGNFINFFITFVYVTIIILGCIFDRIAANIEKMATFLIGFFAISFSVWAGKKVIENIQNVSVAADAITSTLTKLGIKIGDQNKGGG
jgi:uncharacterized membrane protein YoaK (UPF0700 family)